MSSACFMVNHVKLLRMTMTLQILKTRFSYARGSSAEAFLRKGLRKHKFPVSLALNMQVEPAAWDPNRDFISPIESYNPVASSQPPSLDGIH